MDGIRRGYHQQKVHLAEVKASYASDFITKNKDKLLKMDLNVYV
jgi:hypothetical protein